MTGDIVTPKGILKNHRISFENGIITEIEPCSKHEPSRENGLFAAPGFVDIHVHGGGGHDFMDGSEEAFLGAAELHSAHGTTSFLPTTLTCPDSELFDTFEIFRTAKKHPVFGSMFFGLHLEGPYFSKEQAGAQDPRYLLTPVKQHWERIFEKGEGIIARWSAAPELENALLLGRELKKRGILASMGHSDATLEQVERGFEYGYTLLTHFYSGMSGMIRKNGYRIPGMIESGYIIEPMCVEVIADGKHLPHSILGLVFRAKGTKKCALVTDAMRGAGMTEGKTILGSLKNGQECFVSDGVAKLPGGNAFAGSVATCDVLLKNACLAGADLCQAVEMMTATPARLAGMTDRGELKPGKRADIVLFDSEMNIKKTVIGGKTVFER